MSRAVVVSLAVSLAACGEGGGDLPGATSGPGGAGGGGQRGGVSEGGAASSGGSSGGGVATGDGGSAVGEGRSDGGGATGTGGPSDAGSGADGGGSADSGTPGSPTGCVGHVTWPAPDAGTWYTVHFLLVDLQTDAGVADATIALCPSDAGTSCANPSAQADNYSDSSGAATLTGPASTGGLDGFLQITASDYVPLLGYFPAVDNVAFYGASPTIRVAMIATTPTFQEMEAQVGSFSSSRGHVLFTVTDCGGRPLAGVTVACSLSDASSTTAYEMGGMLSTSATATDASGRGLLVNVEPGVGTLTATLKGSGPMSRIDVAVRAAAVTEVALPPTPL